MLSFNQKNYQFFFWLFLLCGIFIWARWADATEYYIDHTSGSDLNVGTNRDYPFEHAPGDGDCDFNCAGVSLGGGDKVFFKKGVVYNLGFEKSITIPNSGTLVIPSVNTPGTTATINSVGVFIDENATFISDGVEIGDYVYIYHSKASQHNTWVGSTGTWRVASRDSETQITLDGFDGESYAIAEMTYRITRPIEYTVDSNWGEGEAIIDGGRTTDYIFKMNNKNQIRIADLALINTRWGSSTALAVGSPSTTASIRDHHYVIDGVMYDGVAVQSISPGDDVIPQGKYGAIAFDIDVTGIISVVEAPGNESGSYDTDVSAYQAIPASESGYKRLGHITVVNAEGAFIFGVDALVSTGATVVSFVSGDDSSTCRYCGYSSGVNSWSYSISNLGAAIIYGGSTTSVYDLIYDNLRLDSHWQGIRVDAQYFSVIKNITATEIGGLVYSVGTYSLMEGSSIDDGGSCIRAAGKYSIIRNNTITNALHSASLYCGNHSDGIGPLFSPSTDPQGNVYGWIIGNYIRDTVQYIFFEYNNLGTRYWTVANNIIHRTSVAGLTGGAMLAINSSPNTIIANNIFINEPQDSGFSSGVKFYDRGLGEEYGSPNGLVENNIFISYRYNEYGYPGIGLGPADIYSSEGFISRYNHFYIPNIINPAIGSWEGVGNLDWSEWTEISPNNDNLGSSCCNIDPMLDVGYSFLAGSPAINTGYASVYPFDKIGVSRPQGSAWDIGAYEFVEESSLQADFDSDSDVDIFDYNILIGNFGTTGDCGNQADADGDCNVGIFDYNILIGEFGSGA